MRAMFEFLIPVLKWLPRPLVPLVPIVVRESHLRGIESCESVARTLAEDADDFTPR